jgi:hypothetical protein
VLEDAREATGHGVRTKRSKSGAVSFDLVDGEVADARSSVPLPPPWPRPRALENPEKPLTATVRLPYPRALGDPHLPLCFARERARHRP